MSAPTRAAGSSLFLRVFVQMLLCVAVVQAMNFALLLGIQTPEAKLFSVGQVATVIRAGADNSNELKLARVDGALTQPWNPRNERTQLALAKSLGIDPARVELFFPAAFLQRTQRYDRSKVPPAAPPKTQADADALVIVGDFVVSVRQPDGRWIRVEPVSRFEPWRLFVLFWLILAAAAVAPFAWALARRLTQPIAAFAGAAERLGRDPRAAPITLTGPPEIADAAASFNRMQARLNRYVDDRATVVGAVAHDLRTPLMRLGLRLEAAPDDLRTACEADIRDMQSMLSATLAYVRDTAQPMVRRRLDLRSLAETVIDDMADRGDAVSLAPGPALVIEGNSAALKAMLVNLVGNAVKYAGGARVSMSLRDGQAWLEVQDDGPGISAGDMEHIFEPFFRGERSRNRNTGGIGLGLASARACARSHGGDVMVANRAEGGLTATVSLPA